MKGLGSGAPMGSEVGISKSYSSKKNLSFYNRNKQPETSHSGIPLTAKGRESLSISF